jgi:hypothetical protein
VGASPGVSLESEDLGECDFMFKKALGNESGFLGYIWRGKKPQRKNLVKLAGPFNKDFVSCKDTCNPKLFSFHL